MTVTLSAEGNLFLPKEIRDALGVTGEEKFDVEVKNGELHLLPRTRGAERAQALFRVHVKNPISSDEFLATRERD